MALSTFLWSNLFLSIVQNMVSNTVLTNNWYWTMWFDIFMFYYYFGWYWIVRISIPPGTLVPYQSSIKLRFKTLVQGSYGLLGFLLHLLSFRVKGHRIVIFCVFPDSLVCFLLKYFKNLTKIKSGGENVNLYPLPFKLFLFYVT